jgi:hypothetical protein
MNNLTLTRKEANEYKKQFNMLISNISRQETPWYKDCIENPNTDEEIKKNPNKYTYFQNITHNNKVYQVKIYIYRFIFGSYFVNVYFPSEHKDVPINYLYELDYLNKINNTYKVHGYISTYYINPDNTSETSIGFCCDNACDLKPFVWNDEQKCITERKYFDPNQIMAKYRDFEFAKKQAKNLAKQLICRYK